MTRVLFMKELREAFASRRFWVILVLSLVLIPLGIEISLKDYQARLQDYREAVRIYQEETKTVSDVLYKEGGQGLRPAGAAELPFARARARPAQGCGVPVQARPGCGRDAAQQQPEP